MMPSAIPDVPKCDATYAGNVGADSNTYAAQASVTANANFGQRLRGRASVIDFVAVDLVVGELRAFLLALLAELQDRVPTLAPERDLTGRRVTLVFRTGRRWYRFQRIGRRIDG